MNTITPLEQAFHLAGGPYAISKICNVSNTSALRWKKRRCLPDTEYLPERHPRKTKYAEMIVDSLRGAMTKDQLLSYVFSPDS